MDTKQRITTAWQWFQSHVTPTRVILALMLELGFVWLVSKILDTIITNDWAKMVAIVILGVACLAAIIFWNFGLPWETKTTKSFKQKVDAGDKPDPLPNHPAKNGSDDEAQKYKIAYEDARTAAYIWEYKFLNLFYVSTTQWVLDWMYSVKFVHTIRFHATWTSHIADANQREIIINVLKQHYLIEMNTDSMWLTPKGEEYVKYRGYPYPSTPNIATESASMSPAANTQSSPTSEE